MRIRPVPVSPALRLAVPAAPAVMAGAPAVMAGAPAVADDGRFQAGQILWLHRAGSGPAGQ